MAAAEAGLFGDIGEGAVAVVAEQVVLQLSPKIPVLRRAESLGPFAIRKIDVGESVVVVVEDADACAGSFDDIVQVAIAIALLEVETGRSCDVGERNVFVGYARLLERDAANIGDEEEERCKANTRANSTLSQASSSLVYRRTIDKPIEFDRTGPNSKTTRHTVTVYLPGSVSK
ncbi:MAG: hypothetical protein ABSH09_10935 [Bryobacteraceae bacterium]